MFTWICPQCGREVPPSYDNCPDCSGKQAAPPAPAAPQPPAAPLAATRPMRPLARRSGIHALPTWLLTVLFTFAFAGLGAAVYWSVGYFRDRSQSAQIRRELSDVPERSGAAKPHPLQKYIEVSGVRFLQDKQKRTEARFVVTNHSPDEISDLGGNVVIWGRTQKSEEESVGSLSFKIPSIGPWESRDLTAPVDTKLRVYELPDWQNITAEVQLTTP